MIHYYFGNKLGLVPRDARARHRPGARVDRRLAVAGRRRVDPAVLIRMHMQTAAANPWIATLIVNEVLAEKGRFRGTFIRDVAGRQAPLVIELLQRARATAACARISTCAWPPYP